MRPGTKTGKDRERSQASGRACAASMRPGTKTGKDPGGWHWPCCVCLASMRPGTKTGKDLLVADGPSTSDALQ